MNHPPSFSSPPSLTLVRSLTQNILKEQQDRKTGRNIIFFAVDGIPHNIASKAWIGASQILEMRSVIPSTSSSAWTSAFTGNTVSQHGVVGTVFKINCDEPPINIYDTLNYTQLSSTGNIFSDAKSLGYMPVALESDLSILSCRWKSDLLNSATIINSGGFFSNLPPNKGSLEVIKKKLKDCIADITSEHNSPKFIWCFLDIDHWIHNIGYSSLVSEFLAFINDFSIELTNLDHVVIAHSDHGLVPIKNCSFIESLICTITESFNATMGGAGRVRWFYSKYPEEYLLDTLKSNSKGLLNVYSNKEYTSANNLTGQAALRIGKAIITPTTDSFINEAGYTYEHGSNSPQELNIPFACWKPDNEI